MKTRGRMIWIPAIMIDEVEDIMMEDKVEERHIALKMMIKYCRVGREAQRIMRLDFRRSAKREPVIIPQPKKAWKVNPKANGKQYLDKEVVPDV